MQVCPLRLEATFVLFRHLMTGAVENVLLYLVLHRKRGFWPLDLDIPFCFFPDSLVLQVFCLSRYFLPGVK